jgi:hypothetical protein
MASGTSLLGNGQTTPKTNFIPSSQRSNKSSLAGRPWREVGMRLNDRFNAKFDGFPEEVPGATTLLNRFR